MLSRARRDNRGLTLIELLVGVTILAIIVVPLLRIFITGAGTEIKSRRYGDATNAVQNLTEQIQALDADTVLQNAATVDSDARFYTYNGSAYTAVGTSAPTVSATLPKTYYIGLQDYSYNDTTFDALITLSVPDDTANSTEVVSSNRLDASLDMTQADAEAVLALQSECGGLMANVDELTIDDLTRSVRFNVLKTADAATDDYRVEALFSYTGLIALTSDAQRGNTYSFSYTKQSSANVASVPDRTDGAPAFSVFLFYNAFYKTGVLSESLVISNTTGSDVNFFIVNTHQTTAPAGYAAQIEYQNQIFSGGTPVNRLVYTNLAPGLVSCSAWKDSLNKVPLDVTGYLVETDARSRKFDVTVSLFEAGSGFIGTPLATLSSTKLNY